MKFLNFFLKTVVLIIPNRNILSNQLFSNYMLDFNQTVECLFIINRNIHDPLKIRFHHESNLEKPTEIQMSTKDVHDTFNQNIKCLFILPKIFPGLLIIRFHHESALQ